MECLGDRAAHSPATRAVFGGRAEKLSCLPYSRAWAARGYTGFMRRIALLFLLGLALACAPRSSDVRQASSGGPRYFGDVTAPRGQVLTFTNGAEPEGIDPGKISGQPDGRIVRALFEGLTTADPQTLEPRPGQAYRWEISADGRTYTFHLRPHLTWSDGTPVTAGDFVWSWTRVLRPETAGRNAGLLYPIENAQEFNQRTLTDEKRLGLAAPDDSTFVVRLAAPTSYFLFLCQYYTFCPVPRQVVEKPGPRWTNPATSSATGRSCSRSGGRATGARWCGTLATGTPPR